MPIDIKQWQEVYDLRHTFRTLRESKSLRFSHGRRFFVCDSRMAVRFLTRATCKNVRQNLIPRATA